ncbi:MAG: N-6 DNA methylase [Thermoanaerobaculaceae bacterium]|nr:N-6 DNA methylase [Thermoanaerobaculaceae bacterium]
MDVLERLKNLIDHFENNLDHIKSPQYNETQVRREFIDPFFSLLGWDVENKQGYAEAYKDVIHEDAIKIGGFTKAPDYCFRIGGTRKFFVEAKKPGVNIKEEIEPAYQLRRYAWSSKLPISILTDFEEFAVYDCRTKPNKSDSPEIGRVKYIKFKDYIKEWDYLNSIFSREAVLKGSFDKYVEDNKKKKGTAEVDKAFLSEIENWRELLARNIALRNPLMSNRELNYAVQSTIDRIIFLRICEDRGIEDYGKIMALQNGEGVYPRLMALFREADEKYNSGLFHFEKEEGRGDPDTIAPSLKIDDKILKEIIKSLYYPESPYEFSVIPADILGQVYEQFLGKVIRLTPSHQAKVEDKPEVKKAGGVYYTPTCIVDYIVKNSVGKFLEEWENSKAKNPENLKLTILDPACGSGSFLLGAYQYLLNWHRDQYSKENPQKYTKGKEPRLYQAEGGEWKLTTSEKKRILLKHIYGVDIDPQAVEVTKLSLLLKVLEGENKESVNKQLKLFKERALPDLSNNIKCGNSLIGSDFYKDKQLGLFDEEEKYRINAFDWEDEFPQIFKEGGFDVVIGNPPYVTYSLGKQQSKRPTEELEYLIKHYHNSSEYKINSFAIFYELGLNLLKQEGLTAFIVPGTILINKALSKIRNFLLTFGKIELVASLRYKVFEGAEMGDCAIIFVRKKQSEKYTIPFHLFNQSNIKQNQIVSHINVEHVKESLDKRIYLSNNSYHLFNIKQKKLFTTIGTLVKFYNGIKTGNNKKFLSSSPLNEKYVPVIRGRDFVRYGFPATKIFVEFDPEKLWSNTDRTKLGLSPKIIIRQTGDKLIATLETKGVYCMDTVHMIYESKYEMKFLLGLINSKFLNYYHSCLVPEFGKAFAEVKISNLKELPVPLVNFFENNQKSLHDKIVSLVDQMLSLHKDLHKAKTDYEKKVIERQIAATDKEIDRLVYELYGLTEEEIKIVEGEISNA